jgi:hypothetical protein
VPQGGAVLTDAPMFSVKQNVFGAVDGQTRP